MSDVRACRCERWNGCVSTAVSTVAATLAMSLAAVVAGTLARWVAHVTGTWPL